MGKRNTLMVVLWIGLGLATTYSILGHRFESRVACARSAISVRHADLADPVMPEMPRIIPVAMALPLPHMPMMPAEAGESRETRCTENNINFGDWGETFHAEESRTIAAPATLEIEAARNGPAEVRGADRRDVGITICKYVQADSQQEADSVFSQIQLVTDGGRISVAGPDERHWSAALFVEVPRNQSLRLQAVNGPADLEDLTGALDLTIKNGPLELRRISGQLHAEAHNGPVSLHEGSGDLQIEAQNGPIMIELGGKGWQGTKLDASTHNGPLEVKVPKGFGSGVEIESGGGPVSCGLENCGVLLGGNRETQHLKIGGDPVVVHLRTDHGPVSIQSAMD